MHKCYDKAYFDTWYRQSGIGHRAHLMRKVALAVATAEYHLQRPIRTVLDIGCGEGAWRAPLLKLRPKLRYLGFDSSEYAVTRYGQRRNLHYARFADFAYLRPCAPVDLLICSDVLHYLERDEIDRGLPGLADLCGGLAFIEAFSRGDAVEGDRHELKLRPASFYRHRLQTLGLHALGSHCWLNGDLAAQASALDLPAAFLPEKTR